MACWSLWGCVRRKSLDRNDRDQVLWASETEHPTQTLVFTNTAGRPTWLTNAHKRLLNGKQHSFFIVLFAWWPTNQQWHPVGREEIRAPLKTPSGEAKCETFVVKMNVICIRIKKIIFVSIAWHLASIWNRGLRQLKNGLLVTLRLCEKKILRQEWPRPGFMSQRDWAPHPNPCFY